MRSAAAAAACNVAALPPRLTRLHRRRLRHRDIRALDPAVQLPCE